MTGITASTNALPDPAVTHESRVFLLDVEGGVRPIDHERYVALARCCGSEILYGAHSSC